jgi:hypothetical protein
MIYFYFHEMNTSGMRRAVTPPAASVGRAKHPGRFIFMEGIKMTKQTNESTNPTTITTKRLDDLQGDLQAMTDKLRMVEPLLWEEGEEAEQHFPNLTMGSAMKGAARIVNEAAKLTDELSNILDEMSVRYTLTPKQKTTSEDVIGKTAMDELNRTNAALKAAGADEVDRLNKIMAEAEGEAAK